MLACARIGAAHTVIFGGFSARGDHATASTTPGAVAIITADGGYRRGAGRAAEGRTWTTRSRAKAPTACKTVIVLQRTRTTRSTSSDGRDVWWHERDRTTSTPTAPPSRSTASTRSSSSTPAAPPASPRASSTPPAATCSAPTAPRKYVFDLRDDDIYWCTADVGWITGHSYIVYGPLANGATDAACTKARRTTPTSDRFWEIIERLQRHDLLHRADRDPRVHQVGRRMARRSTISAACACSAPSASRSIPRRGCGTTR